MTATVAIVFAKLGSSVAGEMKNTVHQITQMCQILQECEKEKLLAGLCTATGF